MNRAFGSMLYSVASYDELEAINHAKRQFIRYIFHEVRVPFNAIVLGIEQMDIELREHYAVMPGAVDTLAIISEQSQVVSRILNDVLSMQKIEGSPASTHACHAAPHACMLLRVGVRKYFMLTHFFLFVMLVSMHLMQSLFASLRACC